MSRSVIEIFKWLSLLCHYVYYFFAYTCLCIWIQYWIIDNIYSPYYYLMLLSCVSKKNYSKFMKRQFSWTIISYTSLHQMSNQNHIRFAQLQCKGWDLKKNWLKNYFNISSGISCQKILLCSHSSEIRGLCST